MSRKLDEGIIMDHAAKDAFNLPRTPWDDLYRILNGVRRDRIILSKHPQLIGFTEAEKKELRK